VNQATPQSGRLPGRYTFSQKRMYENANAKKIKITAM
jgi:hypothetical protein